MRKVAADVTEGGEENGEERQKGAVARTKTVRERVKREGEWRSESKRRTACRGYCDGNVIRKPTVVHKGQSRLPHLPPI